jgi:hypothetical protein
LGVTPADVQAFNQAWMTPDARAGHINGARDDFTNYFLPGAWTTGEVMEAMVRMYDLTHDRLYLDHLRELSLLVLSYRDDRRMPRRKDPFRDQLMPAWGARGVPYGYRHHAGVVIAGVWAYPIAAFARIVAEDPALHADYGADAVAFASATLETVRAFTNELRPQPGDCATYTHPQRYRTLLTETRCDQAYQDALNGFGPDGWASAEVPPKRLQSLRGACTNYRQLAGYPVGHNENHALVMAMIEAWRAVDSPFHRERVSGSEIVDWARASFPTAIKRTHRWFRGKSVLDQRGRRMVWNHADGIPDRFVHVEDSSHAALSMRYLGVLYRSIEHINGALFRAGQEPIDVSPMRQELTNTFLFKIGAGKDLAHTVDGRFSDGERDRYNTTSNGWLDLAQVDDRVYYKCRDIVLRVVEGEQKYLTLSTHASLLANKPALSRRLVNRSAEFGTPLAAGAPTACVIYSLGVHDIVYRDTSRRLHELWRDAAGASGTSNLTALANAPLATSNPFAYVDPSTNSVILLYRGVDAGVHSLYWSTGPVGHDALTGSIGAPKAAGGPVGWFNPADRVHHVVYRTGDGHLHELSWSGASAVGHRDLTALASAPSAAGDPTALVDSARGDKIVVFRGVDGHVRSLYWSSGVIGHEDLSGFAGTPRAGGDPVAYYTAHDDTHQVVYRGRDGRLHELYWPGVAPVIGWVLTPPFAPPASGNPAAYYSAGTNTKHVIYRSADGRLHELRWVPGGGTPAHVDLTAFAAAPPAADRPTAFTVEGPNTQHAAYRDADGNIYEVRW